MRGRDLNMLIIIGSEKESPSSKGDKPASSNLGSPFGDRAPPFNQAMVVVL